MPKLSIVIPCYFNEKNIPVTTAELLKTEALFPSDVTFEYVLVDDGSTDGTLRELLAFRDRHPGKVKVLKLARNFGSINASLAGLNHATGDCVVTIAADLQDPPELIPKMYAHWKNGIKLVLANRDGREDPWTQTIVSNFFHYLMRKLALKNTPPGGFDLFLFDRQVCDIVVKMDEKNTYLPYLYLWLGFEYVSIPYIRKKREIGESQWTMTKKIKAFIDSFVSFSFVPIRAMGAMGFILGAASLVYCTSIIVSKLFGNVPVEGWSSLMIVLLFVSSLQMLSLGVLGEYLWRTLDATRKRPNFVIDRTYG